MLFGAFVVAIEDSRLHATAWGEPVDHAARAGRGDQGRDVHGASRRAPGRRHGSPSVSSMSEAARGENAWISSLLTRKSRCRVVDRAARPHARAGRPLRERSAREGHGRKVYEQVTNVATLPGIERASYAMPDAHWGYGFPDRRRRGLRPDRGGIVSRPAASASTFPAACGCSHRADEEDVEPVKKPLADDLSRSVPAGRRQHRATAPRRRRDGRHAHEAVRGGRWSEATAPPRISNGLRSTAA